MPNWTYNTLKIKAERNLFNKIKDLILNDEGNVDFNRIIPEDRTNPNYQVHTYTDENGNVRNKECIALDGDDTFNWYAWHCDFWGTKWNACDTFVNDTLCDDNDKEPIIFISFNTAWSAPIPIFNALCNQFPDAEITVHCSEESNAFLIDGFNDEGDFDYMERDPDDLIFTPQNKRKTLCEAILDMGLNPRDYNLKRFLDDDNVYFYVEEEDYENNYANPTLCVDCRDEKLKELLTEYKK